MTKLFQIIKNKMRPWSQAWTTKITEPLSKRLRAWKEKFLAKDPEFMWQISTIGLAASLFLLILVRQEPQTWKALHQNFLDFFHIWPASQWFFSIISLIGLYWLTGHYYNKWLVHHGGWLDFKTRVWLILIDLTINLALGLYYMQYRETLMGMIMLRCPIAISPLIFLMEMICVYIYLNIYLKKKK